MAKRGPKPKRMVSAMWSPNLAYAVGLLATDGCLSNDGRHIDFTSKYRYQIVVFKRCLNLNSKIGKKTSGYTCKKIYFRVQFGDVLFYKWLVNIGLTPNKSKSLGKLKIPNKYFFDFLRGCFDGDGSMYAYWDLRWHSSYMFYLQFASASLPFLAWLQESIARLSSAQGKISSSARLWQLRFAKKETLILFKKMFYSKDVPCLRRKLVKAKKIFAINQAH